MAKAPKNKKVEVKSSSISRKEFSYEKAGVTLSFTLRTDVPQELLVFRELLETAFKQVSEEIEKF